MGRLTIGVEPGQIAAGEFGLRHAGILLVEIDSISDEDANMSGEWRTIPERLARSLLRLRWLSVVMLGVTAVHACQAFRKAPPAPSRVSNNVLTAAQARQALIEMLELTPSVVEWPAKPLKLPDFVLPDLRRGSSFAIVDDQNPWSRFASGDHEALSIAQAAEGNPQVSAWKWNCNLTRRTVTFWARYAVWEYVMVGQFTHVRGEWRVRMQLGVIS